MEEKTENARNQAKAQLESIKEMVAALECDYERLEELRDRREALQDEVSVAEEEGHAAGCPVMFQVGSAEHGACACGLQDAREGLAEWNEENAEELAELEAAAGDCKDADDARQRIEEDALSVQVRSGWVSPGEEMEAEEFEILLCTGGPAVKIVGDLGQFNEPESARLYFQDWFTSWEELILDSEDYDALLTYCQVFYFGEA